MNRKLSLTAILAVISALFILVPAYNSYGMTNDDCLMCHDDRELQTDDGRQVGVESNLFSKSVHSGLSCVDCHNQDADYDDLPHFAAYKPVECGSCHEEATKLYFKSVHGVAAARHVSGIPNCAVCHSSPTDPHGIKPIVGDQVERQCLNCHEAEGKAYSRSVHANIAKGKSTSTGCLECHPTHTVAQPKTPETISAMCEECHARALTNVERAGHNLGTETEDRKSCVSCHDQHATRKPLGDAGLIESCLSCHPEQRRRFVGSVHEQLFAAGEINCLTCHHLHRITDDPEREYFGCNDCHQDVQEVYERSAHRQARLHGDRIAATCGGCHNGHNILPANDPESPVNHYRIPYTCGKCHTDTPVITSDYVRLPVSLPSYTESIHGKGWLEEQMSAVCTDCHGYHDLEVATSPTSTINKANLAATCGKCHLKESVEYLGSVHGKAIAHGIKDSPSCTDCHDEHLIYGVLDPRSAVSPGKLADETCANCHEDPEMAARYGLPPGVVESYKDSYHGWAIKRGGKSVALCVDCHNKHDIRSPLDPESSIHGINVVETCGRCHPNSNVTFAASYTHILARDKMMIHDWVRVVYIIVIIVVLGGMFGHNLIIFIHEAGKELKKHKAKPAIHRMRRTERIQHIALIITFSALAISGFALRFPDDWWVRILTDWGLTEEARRIFHRITAVLLVSVSVYHAVYLLITVRGRKLLKAMFPIKTDFNDAYVNMSYYIGLRKSKPSFGMFDYTQKAEYWALIWGTVLMTITGFVLWFPALVTTWLPAWTIRVSEVIHFYEAILAVSAIIIWHLFYVIFLPDEYPVDWTWLTGRMSLEHWNEHHAREPEETGQPPDYINDRQEETP